MTSQFKAPVVPEISQSWPGSGIFAREKAGYEVAGSMVLLLRRGYTGRWT